MNFTYTAYGLVIQSAIELPELRVHKQCSNPDLFISLASVPDFIDLLRSDDYCQSNDTDILINFPDVLRALVTGDMIRLEVLSDCELSVRCILLSSVFSAVLYVRGSYLLHAGAIEFQGRAYAFCGAPGASAVKPL